jgi:flagellar motor switch protein FliN/FliY
MNNNKDKLGEDIEIPVVIELDSFKKPLKEVLNLKPGDILELNKQANNLSVNIIIGGKLLAVGELVIVDEKLGVKLTRWK